MAKQQQPGVPDRFRGSVAVVRPGATPPPASFFLTTIDPPTGTGIGIAQALAGRPSQWEHAGIVIGNGRTVEAAPGGAHYGTVAAIQARPHVFSDAPVRILMNEANFDTPHAVMAEAALRSKVCYFAEKQIGAPYSYADYAALAALHLHLPSAAIRDYVAQTGHEICSQLVDLVYLLSGIHLFDDPKRRPGDVMPSDLDQWIMSRNEVVL